MKNMYVFVFKLLIKRKQVYVTYFSNLKNLGYSRDEKQEEELKKEFISSQQFLNIFGKKFRIKNVNIEIVSGVRLHEGHKYHIVCKIEITSSGPKKKFEAFENLQYLQKNNVDGTFFLDKFIEKYELRTGERKGNTRIELCSIKEITYSII